MSVKDDKKILTSIADAAVRDAALRDAEQRLAAIYFNALPPRMKGLPARYGLSDYIRENLGRTTT